MSAARRGGQSKGPAKAGPSGTAKAAHRGSPGGGRHRFRAARYGLLLIAACALVYANSLNGPFVLDDHTSIVGNSTLNDWTNLGRVFVQPRDTPLAGRPLVAWTFAMNRAASGLAVQSYHLTNIGIHALCALLLFGIVRRTLARMGQESDVLAFAVALVWAVHPLNSEVLNYLTERTEGLMALFLLMSLYAAIRAATSARRMLWQAGSVLACGLGMLCKESMIVAPVLIVLYDRIFLFESFHASIAARWRLYGCLALTWIALLYMIVPGPRSNSVGFNSAITPWNYLLNQAAMITRYFRLAVWPQGLVVNYGPPIPLRMTDVAGPALLVIGLLTASAAALRWFPAAGFLGAWIFITLAPTSSIVPIATEVGAERRMYLPMMAIAALAVIPALRTLQRRVSPKLATALVALLTVVPGTLTFMRNREYATPLSLAESTLRHWPTDVAHGMVGSALGDLHRDAEAVRELQLASRTDARSRYNLAVELYNLRRYDEAIAELDRFAGENPMNELVPSARQIQGDAFAAQRRWPEAINRYRLALSMHDTADTRKQMTAAMSLQGLAMADAGRFAEAAALFRSATEWEPTAWGAHYNLASALLDAHDAAAYAVLARSLAIQGRYAESMAQFREALTLAPGDASIQHDLDRVLAVSRN
jgi:tetratricopeptide (TPR) repeat protein